MKEMTMATSEDIISTLRRMRREIQENGLTESAGDMWLQALEMRRKYKLSDDEPTSNVAPFLQEYTR